MVIAFIWAALAGVNVGMAAGSVSVGFGVFLGIGSILLGLMYVVEKLKKD